MTIASEVQRIKDNIEGAYTSASEKGAVLPATKNSDNLASCIDTIVKPTGNINITNTNSTNVTAYATAKVVDSNLVASNIKKDIKILGVTGTLEEGGVIPSGNKAITASTTTQTGIDVTNYATVSVAPTPSETKSITANGTYTPTSGKLISSVTVNVESVTDEAKAALNSMLGTGS